MTRRDTVAGVLAALAVGTMLVSGAVALGAVPGGEVAFLPGSDASPEDDRGDETARADGERVSEERYEAPVPEEGDEYFEEAADDGSWVSYRNPRDRYRDPYVGDASGKVCVTLLNEAGEVVAGESVPDTNVTVPTGESLAWHSLADPMVVQFPLTDHYDRPLDSDQFGTDPDLPQGDGSLDAHCVEFHGPPEDAVVEYGEAAVTGEHADRVEVVGYVQQANDAWETDVDPVDDAVPYDEAGGGWRNREGGSHGQVVVVLQLREEADA